MNRFFTVLIIPEKTSQVRRFVVPTWLVRGALVAGLLIGVTSAIMVLDYWFVMNQISENKDLKVENRRLRQQVQVFRNKIATIESTLDRIKTFATRLKVITNIEDRGGLIQSLQEKLPEASTNLALFEGPPPSPGPSPGIADASGSTNAAAVVTPDSRSENDLLDSHFTRLNRDSLLVELTLQDQYELLADQKAFLAALPTRTPAPGIPTSGFGVRRSPYGGRIKMHEGMDIANHPGVQIQSTADGVVTYADVKAGYGQTVIIDHGYGLETWYAHARKLLVSKGQRVHRGESIALLGNSGRSTGPHVHYEVRVNGWPVDPRTFVLEN